MAELQVQTFPVLPLKNTVLFPYLLMPLSVGRASSLAAVEAALATESKEIVLFAQHDSNEESPKQEDLYSIGTRAVIRKVSRPNENTLELLVMGVERVTLVKLDSSEPFLRARVVPLPLPTDQNPEVEALQGALVELASTAIAMAQPNVPQELGRMLAGNEDPCRVACWRASKLSPYREKDQP